MQTTPVLRTFSHVIPPNLSGGQARRVALARAIAPRRPLILMDEPLTNLDDEGRRDLVNVIQRFWEGEKFALLYVTHDVLEEITFARRIIRLDKGRLINDHLQGPADLRQDLVSL